MDSFQEILKITQDEAIDRAENFKELINKKLVLGMTKYMCKNGTLSDGHEKITPSQRYYQSIKEMWFLANNIIEHKAQALDAQAELLDCTRDTSSPVDQLRFEAREMRAKQQLTKSLISIQDAMRQLQAFDEVRRELEPMVDAQYPEGIEQSEEDNWTAVGEYRATLRHMGFQQNMTHVPLPIDKKIELGVKMDCPDLGAWHIVQNKQEIVRNHSGNVTQYLEFKFGKKMIPKQ